MARQDELSDPQSRDAESRLQKRPPELSFCSLAAAAAESASLRCVAAASAVSGSKEEPERLELEAFQQLSGFKLAEGSQCLGLGFGG